MRRDLDDRSGRSGNERRAFYIDLFSAILLGAATVLGAYAAYQSSLWGGNCQTAYMQGTNKLGEANREMLKSVQEQSFDAVVWMENLKAHEVAKAQEAASAHAEEEDEEDEHSPNLSEEQRAQAIVQQFEY
ncbi:MAG TPA: hypothetical protein VM580_29195, partial [Labilithrix sp.]|nr:hypothetical protein [Labilithrix sp.]